MKKVIFAAMVLVSGAAFAHGGNGAGAMGGNPDVQREKLEATWNGKAGVQQTPMGGVIVQWFANEKGEWVSEGWVTAKQFAYLSSEK